MEPYFDPQKDAWFDLDLREEDHGGEVELSRREFELHGDASNWLTSEAFDLPSPRSLESETLLREVSAFLENPLASEADARTMHHKLASALSPRDSYLFRWRAICEKKGLL